MKSWAIPAQSQCQKIRLDCAKAPIYDFDKDEQKQSGSNLLAGQEMLHMARSPNSMALLHSVPQLLDKENMRKIDNNNLLIELSWLHMTTSQAYIVRAGPATCRIPRNTWPTF
jgi:hypothetical protein